MHIAVSNTGTDDIAGAHTGDLHPGAGGYSYDYDGSLK